MYIFKILELSILYILKWPSKWGLILYAYPNAITQKIGKLKKIAKVEKSKCQTNIYFSNFLAVFFIVTFCVKLCIATFFIATRRYVEFLTLFSFVFKGHGRHKYRRCLPSVLAYRSFCRRLLGNLSIVSQRTCTDRILLFKFFFYSPPRPRFSILYLYSIAVWSATP